MTNTKIAKFSKVSYDQFLKDYRHCITNTLNDEEIYSIWENINLPKRATSGSAGYDFTSTATITLKPNDFMIIPTGIRCEMEEGFVLQVYPRSSFGMKYQMCLTNTVGIIDADYYHAKNEGHIMTSIVNRGNQDLTINLGERFTQGIFYRFFLADEEEVTTKRVGGYGSSGK